MYTDTKATVTFQGETRELRAQLRLDNGRLTVFGMVATIGRGVAKYPVLVSCWPGHRPGSSIQVTTEDGRTWHAGNVVVRNRQARITGWAEAATNLHTQERV